MQSIITGCLVALIPSIEGAASQVQLGQRLLDWQRRLLHQPNELQFLRSIGTGHPSHSSPVGSSRLFFSTRFFNTNSATSCLSCSFSRRRSLTSSLLACRLVSPVSRALPASRNSLLHL